MRCSTFVDVTVRARGSRDVLVVQLTQLHSALVVMVIVVVHCCRRLRHVYTRQRRHASFSGVRRTYVEWNLGDIVLSSYVVQSSLRATITQQTYLLTYLLLQQCPSHFAGYSCLQFTVSNKSALLSRQSRVHSGHSRLHCRQRSQRSVTDVRGQ